MPLILPWRSKTPQVESIPTTDGGARVQLVRGREVIELAELRPNMVHTAIIRADGSLEDLGVNHNTRTSAGADWQANIMGGLAGTNTGTPATATTSTSLTRTSSGWTTDAYKGWRVYAGAVYGNVASNTSTVLTVDAWYNPDNTVGSTPSSTAAFFLLPNAAAEFIGLTTDTTTITGSETSLTSELSSNGLGRALGTYAHTNGTTSYTVSKTFSATGTTSAINRAGLFTGGSGGTLVFITNLNAQATVANGDSLAVTWTVNI